MTNADRLRATSLAAQILHRYRLDPAARRDEIERLTEQIAIAITAHLEALGLEET